MKLYKYFSSERINVLRDSAVRYTQPAALNDPFEAKPYISKIAKDQELEQTLDELLHEEVKKAYDKWPEEMKSTMSLKYVLGEAENKRASMLGELGQMLGALTPKIQEIFHSTVNEYIGILSLTEKPDNLLMWSHYATNHEGFVIGFDSRHDYFNQRISPVDEFRHLRKVEYREKRPNAPMTELDAVEFLLVKSKEWEYEQEWRIMRPLSDSDKTINKDPFAIYLFEYPPEAVVEVIIGVRMNSANRSRLLKILEGNQDLSHVDVLQASPDEQEFKLHLLAHKKYLGSE